MKENQIMKNNIVIRLEEKSEYRKVENLVRDSFWNVYRPGCLEHYALKKILIFMEEWIQAGKRVWYPLSWIARGGRCIILSV